MREIRTSGSMSGAGKRGDASFVPAPILDSTENKGSRDNLPDTKGETSGELRFILHGTTRILWIPSPLLPLLDLWRTDRLLQDLENRRRVYAAHWQHKAAIKSCAP